ncbi:hypothetical protein OC709_02270 ['Planchonia careya' phytoplasma]|nr:hypothetical protein ['Planchonia careya' phytoplasma]MDO8030324.1 hypothetical protein ['Planchonia careya' phytoplasma]
MFKIRKHKGVAKQIKQSIYDLVQIIHFLEKQNSFQIYLFRQKTNFNPSCRTLFLNYQDIPEISHLLLGKILNPPFQIEFIPDLEQEYHFLPETKVLKIQQKYLTPALENRISPTFTSTSVNEK